MNFNDTIGFDKDNARSKTADANRYTGGSDRTAGDHPYIKGYFYVFFGLPSTLFGNNDNMSKSDAQNFLLVSAESYTPPGDRQINIQDINGQGGVGASFITGQTITREFSIQYKDYWGAPIFRIHRQWTNFINPYTGVAHVSGNESAFGSKDYKGVCMVIQTKPVARGGASSGDALDFNQSDIIKIDLFDGVQPLTDLKSAYDANIEDNSFVKPTVQYKFDGFPLDETYKDLKENAVAILNKSNVFKNTMDTYTNLSNNSENLGN